MNKYFGKHASYNSITHFLIGLGVGIILNPWTWPHPMRVGGALLAAGLIMHIYSLMAKK